LVGGLGLAEQICSNSKLANRDN